MAATPTVAQDSSTFQFSSPSSVAPRTGVITLFGYGIKVQVERGHLTIEDGVGADRQRFRLPRIGHGLERLIVIGNDGLVSLAALRWLADQKAAFVMLERDGKVVCVTGPVRPSDARLRRAQAIAHQSDAALRIARELIDRKLAGQEKVAREKLSNNEIANEILRLRSGLAEVETIADVRLIESMAAAEYWSAWRNLPITFPKLDLVRTPEHWRRFDTRRSVLTGSSRLATNPVNAILNYLYAILESESRLALAALGLDPGLGFIHMDAPARDSLACDLMETVRPKVDAYVLDWITRYPLKREWFFEQRDGNCRLMAQITTRLSETAPMWRHAVAPVAEWITRTLWIRKSTTSSPPSRLTKSQRRQAQGGPPAPAPVNVPKHKRFCTACGAQIGDGSEHCSSCALDQRSGSNFASTAQLGRAAGHTQQAEEKRREKLRLNTTARRSWDPSTQPAWFTEVFYRKNVLPKLASLSNAVIANALGVSRPYAAEIRKGRLAHPRHWQKLAALAKLDKPLERARGE